jgi:hypothetical protein
MGERMKKIEVNENMAWIIFWMCSAMVLCSVVPTCIKAVKDEALAEEKSFQTAVQSGMSTEDLQKLFYKK